MRKVVIVTGVLVVGIGLWYVWYSSPTKSKMHLPTNLAPLAPRTVGAYDIFEERSLPEKVDALSDAEFRERFQNVDVVALLETATVSSLRERFGEPHEYSYKDILYSGDDLPGWFKMKYPTGVMFHIEEQRVAQIDLSEPGYLYKGALQVGSSLDEVCSVIGEPEEILEANRSNVGSWGEYYLHNYMQPGSMYFKGTKKFYWAKEKNPFLIFDNDTVTHMRIWRPISGWHSASEVYCDTSKSLSYLWNRGSKCADNLSQLGAALLAYSNTAKGNRFPALSSEPGCFSYDSQALIPTNFDIAELFECPAADKNQNQDSPDGVGKRGPSDYLYFGYCIGNEREGMAFLAAYYDHIIGEKPFEGTLETPERMRAGTRGDLISLRQGASRFYYIDIGNPANYDFLIPLVVERPGNHGVPGGHVLYMDGHAEWLPYPGPFPMTPAFIEGVKAVEERLRKIRSATPE
jgi:hypothetical protein